LIRKEEGMFATPIKKRRIGFLPPDLKNVGYYVRPPITFSGFGQILDQIKSSGYGILLIGSLAALFWYGGKQGWFDREM
jgi:hypothetical protein